MAKDPDRESMLRRRLACEQLHLNFLHSLATNPATIDSEIARRLQLITDAKETISQHEAAIRLLQTTRDTVQDAIIASEKKTKYFKHEVAKLSLEKYINEYLKINKRLESYDADS